MKHGYTFVYVPGSWHDGSLLADVKYHLRRYRGRHDVHTPTVAGHGPGADTNVSHADAVDSIVEYVEDHDLNDVILVGHSFGGTILTQAAPRLLPRLKRLVFHNAFVVEDGKALRDEVPPEMAAMFDDLTDPTTGTIMLPFPAWRDNFLQDAGYADAQEAYDRLTPEPAAMINDVLDQKAFFDIVAAGSLPMSYLNAYTDIALPHGDYQWYPRFARRLGYPRVVQMEGSHEVCFSNPRRLAEAIYDAGRD